MESGLLLAWKHWISKEGNKIPLHQYSVGNNKFLKKFIKDGKIK
jgi:hypothetical protein